jgi:hypothetical protein
MADVVIPSTARPVPVPPQTWVQLLLSSRCHLVGQQIAQRLAPYRDLCDGTLRVYETQSDPIVVDGERSRLSLQCIKCRVVHTIRANDVNMVQVKNATTDLSERFSSSSLLTVAAEVCSGPLSYNDYRRRTLFSSSSSPISKGSFNRHLSLVLQNVSEMCEEEWEKQRKAVQERGFLYLGVDCGWNTRGYQSPYGTLVVTDLTTGKIFYQVSRAKPVIARCATGDKVKIAGNYPSTSSSGGMEMHMVTHEHDGLLAYLSKHNLWPYLKLICTDKDGKLFP